MFTCLVLSLQRSLSGNQGTNQIQQNPFNGKQQQQQQQNTAESSSATLSDATAVAEKANTQESSNVQQQQAEQQNPQELQTPEKGQVRLPLSKNQESCQPEQPPKHQEQTKGVNTDKGPILFNDQTVPAQQQQQPLSGFQVRRSQSFSVGQTQGVQIRLANWQQDSTTPQTQQQQQQQQQQQSVVHQQQLNRIAANQMQKSQLLTRGYAQYIQIRPPLVQHQPLRALGPFVKLDAGSYEAANNNQAAMSSQGLGPHQSAKTGADVINYLISRGTLQAGPEHQNLVNQPQLQHSLALHQPVHAQQQHQTQQLHHLVSQQQYGMIQQQQPLQQPQQNITYGKYSNTKT